jgi:hypothetical protein
MRWAHRAPAVGVIVLAICALTEAGAGAGVDCLDTQAALSYWRPIREKASTSEAPPDALALELVSCLSSPVAELRDRIGYELFTLWLRNDRLTDATRKSLVEELSVRIATPPAGASDNAALGRSFSALILAELMRSDAQKPFMSSEARQTLLERAATALERETDFRGLEADVGWVHPVAHLSDLLWRFALHPESSSAQAEMILAAVKAKIAPTLAFYTFNESDRLARVVSTIIRNELVDAKRMGEWLRAFESPQSMDAWSDAFSSREGMAELHNTKLFMRALSDQLAGEETSPQITEPLDALVNGLTQWI